MLCWFYAKLANIPSECKFFLREGGFRRGIAGSGPGSPGLALFRWVSALVRWVSAAPAGAYVLDREAFTQNQ